MAQIVAQDWAVICAVLVRDVLRMDQFWLMPAARHARQYINLLKCRGIMGWHHYCSHRFDGF